MARFSLSSFLLFIAIAAVWISYFVKDAQITELEAKVTPLRVVSSALRIEDPDKIAAVKNLESVKDYCWKIYLPSASENEEFVIAMAQIEDPMGQLPPLDDERVQVFPIEPGTHDVSFVRAGQRYSKGYYELAVDDDVHSEFQFKFGNYADWEGFFDSSSTQIPAKDPLILYPNSWNIKSELVLWIQKRPIAIK